jgi:hypothetical protein
MAAGRNPGGSSHRIGPTAVIGFAAMAKTEPSFPDNEPRVVAFHRRGGAFGKAARLKAPSPVEDLAKYERSEDADDYRHRMLINAVALVFVAALIGAGLWIADTMAQMRKNQDCVLSGRSGCTPVTVEHRRW